MKAVADVERSPRDVRWTGFLLVYFAVFAPLVVLDPGIALWKALLLGAGVGAADFALWWLAIPALERRWKGD